MTSHRVHNLRAWDAAVLDARRIVTRAQKCRAFQCSDGFDTYNTSLLSARYTVSGSPTWGPAYRRSPPPSGLPGQGVYLPNGAYIRRALISTQSTVIPRVAYCPLALPGGSPASILGWFSSSGNFLQVAL